MRADLSKPLPTNSYSVTFSHIKTYMPLIVAVSIVIIATYGLEYARSMGSVAPFHEVMNAFMGFFFLVFAVPKLFNLHGFAMAFSQYDLITQRYPFYAKAYPFIEIGLAALLISNLPMYSSFANVSINGVIIILTSIGIIGITKSLRMNKHIDCACLGAKFTFPLSNVAIVENVLMLVMAIGMLFFSSGLQMTSLSLGHSNSMNGSSAMGGMKQ